MDSKKVEIVPFTEYNSTLSRFNNSNQLQAKQYKQVIESTLNQAVYERQNNFLGDVALSPLNANIPRFNKTTNYIIKDKSVPIYEEFWQYKQPAGTIFTDWESAGVQNLKTDLSIRQMPFNGNNNLSTQDNANLVLSNVNNVRNNLQRYGKEYLTNTNLLNSEAFYNGVSYESGGSSTYRSGLPYDSKRIIHGNFGNSEEGDLYQRTQEVLRVDLPSNYVNSTLSSWQYINPAFIIPNPDKRFKIFQQKIKYGLLTLDAMKLTGDSCLTSNYGVIPTGLNEPMDVYNDRANYPPLFNPEYYSRPNSNFMLKDGQKLPNNSNFIAPGRNLYCSPNTNYVAMPINHLPQLKGLDTSIQVAPGTNSVTLGTVMSPKLKDFINNDLYEINLCIILSQLMNNETDDNNKNKIKNLRPSLFDNTPYGKDVHIKYRDYNKLSENQKYKYLFNIQRTFVTLHTDPETERFILNLSIVKFGGYNSLNIDSQINCTEINKILNLDPNDTIKLDQQSGIFLLLPTMLSEDMFIVRNNIPTSFNNNMNSKNGFGGNNCIESPNQSSLNAVNCAYRDSSGKWQQITKPGDRNASYVPNVSNPNSSNLNDSIYNMRNSMVGSNPYNVPNTF